MSTGDHEWLPFSVYGAGFLGQMGPTADGVNSQAASTAQAVKSQAAPATQAVKSQAAPAAEALKTQAQSLAPSGAESASQGLQPPAPSGSVVDSAKAAGEQLQNQSGTDLVPSIGNVGSHAPVDERLAARLRATLTAAVSIVVPDAIAFVVSTIAAVAVSTIAAVVVSTIAAVIGMANLLSLRPSRDQHS